jgi:hypothetical protein
VTDPSRWYRLNDSERQVLRAARAYRDARPTQEQRTRGRERIRADSDLLDAADRVEDGETSQDPAPIVPAGWEVRNFHGGWCAFRPPPHHPACFDLEAEARSRDAAAWAHRNGRRPPHEADRKLGEL